eukprot:UN00986
MSIILTKLKTPVLNALTRGEIICDDIIPKDHILWELHEAEAWWDDNKLALKNGEEKPSSYLDTVDGVELLSDDGIESNIHGFSATHMINQTQDDVDTHIQKS